MPKRIGLVMGSFHKEEITKMLEEARITALNNNLEIVEEIWVPGSVEKPLAVQTLLKRDDVDGVAMLGIIEKGGTKHGFTMGQSLMDITMKLSLDYSKPVCLGVLGPGIEPDQIEPRLLPYANKSIEALSMMLKREWK
ncbi:6,7-dimethyl-8-ribityllumazine synthase [Candidatus Uhrbacteria bacterium]|jgi:6,7-dimethyl-8-ribityllumazine synthase|nr:6,7-dimethyl-8-ribityllumazine synthase [Candidatus Uhrbacteria bacterium]